jgi:primosomal protein N' (replication factor Y)
MGHAESLAAWARATGLGVRRLKRLLEEGYVGYGPPPEARGEEGEWSPSSCRRGPSA